MYWQYYLMGIILVPGLIFAAYAQIKVSVTFNKYSKINSYRGIAAKDVARNILDSENLYNVSLRKVSGHLTDHFDPRTNSVSLSESVSESSSLAAVAVAAHEVGHAIQHGKDYAPMKLRTLVVKLSNVSSVFLWPLVVIGLMLNLYLIGGVIGDVLLWSGIAFFGLSVILNLVTLPVEFNASKRALSVLVSTGSVDTNEIKGCKRVLSAAAMTYVAALIVSILYLARFIIVILASSRRD